MFLMLENQFSFIRLFWSYTSGRQNLEPFKWLVNQSSKFIQQNRSKHLHFQQNLEQTDRLFANTHYVSGPPILLELCNKCISTWTLQMISQLKLKTHLTKESHVPFIQDLPYPNNFRAVTKTMQSNFFIG
jgi:hypothetical protein